ncbi:hypothetical protein ABLU79_21045 [Klebsiella sp. GG_Kp152]|uniref:hypothetical protein n=1 Tax=Klebsiella sp. GG_Kp152 TaxID=3153463 RepID=UPI0032B5804D
MNIETVNELIASLESAGELSIKETKVMALAKAFKQLAAENMELKEFPEQIVQFIGGLGTSEIGSDTKEKIGLAASRIKAPATDAYLAGIKADGVEDMANHFFKLARAEANSLIAEQWRESGRVANEQAKQLREGAK